MIIPKTLYHGTNYCFDRFSKEMIGTSTDNGIAGKGFYFFDNIDAAKNYGLFILTVNLNLNNPFIIPLGDSIQSCLRRLDLLTSDKYPRNLVGQPTCSPSQATDILLSRGFDGVIKLDHYNHEYIVFESDQITVLEIIKPKGKKVSP